MSVEEDLVEELEGVEKRAVIYEDALADILETVRVDDVIARTTAIRIITAVRAKVAVALSRGSKI